MTESESGAPAPTEPDGAQTGGEPADVPDRGHDRARRPCRGHD